MWGTFPTCPSCAQHKTDRLGVTSASRLKDFPGIIATKSARPARGGGRARRKRAPRQRLLSVIMSTDV